MLPRPTRSRRLALALVAPLLLILAACGDDSSDAASGAEPDD